MKTGKVDLGCTEEWLINMTAPICNQQTLGSKDTAIAGDSVTYVKHRIDSTVLQNLLLFILKFTKEIV